MTFRRIAPLAALYLFLSSPFSIAQTPGQNINMVSGATDSSDAFAQSLQSAILKAKKA